MTPSDILGFSFFDNLDRALFGDPQCCDFDLFDDFEPVEGEYRP